MPEHRPAPPVAGYLAQPHEVHRVVLLYSGGLDTSVMLKWIQDEYDAEVVALCIDLGPAGRRLRRGAPEGPRPGRRREPGRRRQGGVRPRLRGARDPGQRPLPGRVPAVHIARPPAAGEAGLRRGARARRRHDRARLHRQGQRPGAHRGDDRDPRAGPEGHRAGARVADGPRRGDRLRAGARHPGRRRRSSAPTRSTTTSGAARARAASSRTSTSRRPRTSSSSSPRPRRRPTGPRTSSSASATACR